MNEMGLNVIPNLKPGILAKHPYKKNLKKMMYLLKIQMEKEIIMAVGGAVLEDL